MRKIEVKICRKCRNPYMWESGGIIMTPADHADRGLCKRCRLNPINRLIYGEKFPFGI